MERLSEKLASVIDECINAWSQIEEDTCKAAIKRLAHYEDLEEQGRLVVLPCKVGDTVYQWGWKHSECHLGVTPPYRPCSECEGCCADECDSEKTAWLYSGRVAAFRIDKDGVLAQIAWDDKWDTGWYNIGKTVFLTREEAEKALKEDA